MDGRRSILILDLTIISRSLASSEGSDSSSSHGARAIETVYQSDFTGDRRTRLIASDKSNTGTGNAPSSTAAAAAAVPRPHAHR